MRVRLQNGRVGELCRMGEVVSEGEIVDSRDEPVLQLDPRTLATVRRVDDAREAGFVVAGLRSPAAMFGAAGGRATSPAKAAAARANGSASGAPLQAQILEALADCPGTVKFVSARLGANPATVRTVMDRMADRGALVREVDGPIYLYKIPS